jgi:sugar/nucleoside kinase (ribokinase family)
VLKDLAALGAAFPLEAAGLLGEDAGGDWIEADLRAAGVSVRFVRRTAAAPTSYTDAMTVASTGRRTFFHHRGTNALLTPDELAPAIAGSSAKVFYLGYLMLLDALDELVDGATGAARVLRQARGAGFITAVDMVSIGHPEFRARVLPALPEIDILFLNEREAALVLGEDLPDGEAARAVLDCGVRDLVVLHSSAGAVAAGADGILVERSALRLPAEFIAGATGAGDAFAAGCLMALHDGAPVSEALDLGVCAAAASLADPTPSAGVLPADDCLVLGRRFG